MGLLIIKDIPNDNYISQILLVLSGIAVLGFGITLSVIADVILNSAEAFVKAISDVTFRNFSTVKIIFDVIWVAGSIVLSNQLAGNLGYENLESLSLYVSREHLPHNDNNNDIALQDKCQA